MKQVLKSLFTVLPISRISVVRGIVFAGILFSGNVQATPPEQVNIVLLLADDLGFSDIGSFGSEIRTPHLDALAETGVRFSNYHTAASCAPTRAMLMTGVDSHRAGVANMPESLPSSQFGAPGYSGVLGQNVLTIAEHLQQAGYHTYMTGKWHLGKTPDALPSARGFERTLIMADTGADNWEQKPYIPAYDKASWFANGVETRLPDDFYSSKTFIDKTISFIEADRIDGKPFFAYVAFQAVHIPVQAPREFTEKYHETYQRGWEVLRKNRYQGAIEKGVVKAGLIPAEMVTTEDWDALDESARRYEAKTMAVYAGMVEAMDHHIGRLTSYLKETGQYDNTVFIFLSDNGAEPSDMLQNPDQSAVATHFFRWWLENNRYNTEYDSLGEKHSYNMIGPSFASAAVSPLSYYKFFTGEGGMRVPLIIAGPDTPLGGQVVNAFTYVTDLVPTMLSLAGVPLTNNPAFLAPEGKNLVPLIEGQAAAVRKPDESVGFELGGNIALFQGDYKLIRNRDPIGDNVWHLFNIVEDPAESRDLADMEPGRLAEMIAAYRDYEVEYGVLPVPEGYDQRRQVAVNALTKRVQRLPVTFILAPILLFVIIPGLLFIYFRRLKRK